MRMQSFCLLLSGLLGAGVASAQDNGLESAAKRLLHDTARDAAPPEPPPGAGDAANRSIEKAKNQKESGERVPAIIQVPPPVANPAAPAVDPAKAAPEPAKPTTTPSKKPARKSHAHHRRP